MTDDPKPFTVFEGLTLEAAINVADPQLVSNVEYAIRQQHPQMWPHPPQADRVCLVGGGPSLESTFPELVDLLNDGAKLVTVNGAYRWCVERNLRPTAQIVVDARQSSAKFLEPYLPACRYFLASQCHPDTWDAVRDRQYVAVFHSVAPDNELLKPVLDKYYLGVWAPISGGSTVALRAIAFLRALGYLRFDLFGVDSCFMGDAHHAYVQPENDTDSRYKVRTCPTNRPDLARDFWVAPWHLAQADDFVRFIKYEGEHFLLNVHGDGLLAYLLASGAEVPLPPSS